MNAKNMSDICLKYGSIIAGIFAVVLGCLVIVGWFTGNLTLLQVGPGFVPMQINTATGFVLTGTAILAAQRRLGTVALACGILAALFGLLTLLENTFSFDLRVNEMLIGYFTGDTPPYLRRMAPGTAACALLAGIAVICFVASRRSRLAIPLAGILGSIVASIGAIATLGYVMGLSGTYIWGHFTGMAVHTALGYAIVGAGIGALAWRAEALATTSPPKWLPAAVGASGLTITLVLWQAMQASEQAQIQKILQARAASVRNEINLALHHKILGLMERATQWEYSKSDFRESVQRDVKALIQSSGDFRAIGWADSSKHIAWVIAPRKEDSWLEYVDFASLPRQHLAMETARNQRKLVITSTVDVPAVPRSYMVYIPVFRGAELRGFTMGLFRAQEMLNTIIDEDFSPGYAVVVLDDARELYRNSGLEYQTWKEESFLPDLGWVIRVWPLPSTMASLDSQIDGIILIAGLLVSTLMVVVTAIAQTSRRRARTIEAVNTTLEQEIIERKQAEQELNTRYHYLETVQSISESILDASDITHILDDLLEKTMAASGCDFGNIRVFNAGGKIIGASYQGYRDAEKAHLRHTTVEATERRLALREVVESGRVLVIEDMSSETRMKNFKEEGAQSAIAVPLSARGEVYGALALAARARRHFQPAEVRLLESIGAEIGMGVQKSRLLEETKRQAEKLEQASKLQADFSAMIAHDLRSPLYTIIGAVEMMKDGLFGSLNEEQKNWLDRVRNNATGLINLVSDFLDVSKLESGRIELSRTKVHIEDLVHNTVQNFAPLASSKHIALTYAADASLLPIHADARRLEQVLTNLLSNAVKFTGQGGAIQIRLRSEDHGGVRLEIHDSGVGIPRAEIASLFQKYRQVNNLTVSAEKGSGLGLVICKMIIDAHGGEIWVDSEEGRGATFAFTLPFDGTPIQTDSSSPTETDNGYSMAPNR